MARTKSAGKPWTNQEDQRLRELAATGATRAEIAGNLDRTESGIKTRAHVLRLTIERLAAKRGEMRLKAKK
jgi:hypothetical protein